MKLFYSPTSPYVRKVMVTAMEKGLDGRIEKIPASVSPIAPNKDVAAQNPLMKVPCLIIHAANDDIASVKNAQLVVKRVSAPTELVLLEDSCHMITIDRERDVVINRSAEFFKRIVAEKPSPATMSDVA